MLSLLAAALIVLPVHADTTRTAPPPVEKAPVTLAIHGFVNSTLYLQDASMGFGNGQSAEWASREGAEEDAWILGGDIRASRLSLGISGPELIPGWKSGGLLELDFFGAFNGSGPFSDEQPQARLRHAYVDLVRGNTTLRMGQSWSPLVAVLPASLSHIAFPLGLGSAGMVGWRFPGVFLVHRSGGEPTRPQLTAHLAAFRGSWAGPGNNLEGESAGEAALFPQLEARVDLSRDLPGRSWFVSVVAHYDRKDLSGIGPDTLGLGELPGRALQASGRLAQGKLTLQGNVYRGRAIGQQMGHLAQFGDIEGVGGWTQAGWSFSPRWSAWLFQGWDDPDDADVVRETAGTGRLRNRSAAAMLRYADGPYAVGVEWLRASTLWSAGMDGGELSRDASQLSMSVLLSF